MKTIPLYFDDSQLYSSEAKVESTGQDARGNFIVLDKTIFYPQGGGQPFDQGSIGSCLIQAVRLEGEEARHYTQEDPTSLVGHIVEIKIDGARRKQHCLYHTAGHLLSHIIESLYPHLKGIKGHHYLDGAYVEFAGQPSTLDLDLINQKLEEAIKRDYSISSWCDGAKRYVQIGPYDGYACGGTHIKTTKELMQVKATKQKGVKVSYTL